MLIMCRGLPAAGKTSWAKEQVANGNGKVKRVNKDDLRAMIDNGKYSRERENEILDIRDTLISIWLMKGHTVIVDDTNLSSDHPERLKKLADLYNVPFKVQDFTHVSPTECLKRNRERPNSVPDNVIVRMWRDYLKPVPYGGSDWCVICDLDGTLCDLNGRNPYDASTCFDDLPNGLVVDLVLNYREQGMPLYFFSGRSDKYRQETEQWLIANVGIPFNLVMRKEGDTRADEIVKREMYEDHIEGQWNVWTVIDDRLKVCRMWYFDLGLPLLNVGPPGIEF